MNHSEDKMEKEIAQKSLSFEHKDFVNDPFLEALDEWVWEMDVNGIHTYSNGAVEKILGYKVEEVVGYSTTKLWLDSSLQRNLDYFKKSLAEGKGWKNFPAYFKHKNGSVKILDSSAIPVYNKHNKLAGYRGIDRDITLRIQNENELKTQQQHVKLINKILRHDLTNNLNVIRSAIRLFEKGYELNIMEEIKKYLDRSFKLIKNMSEMEILLNKNKEMKVFEIREVLDKIGQDFSGFEINICGSSRILADEMIYSIFENLINNARTHGEADKIDLDIEKKEGICIITVADNGRGIPDEIKDKIFEEGFKYGDKGNTGIGLHIVKTALDRYGGKIEVSDNVPQGAVFKLSFKRLG